MGSSQLAKSLSPAHKEPWNSALGQPQNGFVVRQEYIQCKAREDLYECVRLCVSAPLPYLSPPLLPFPSIVSNTGGCHENPPRASKLCSVNNPISQDFPHKIFLTRSSSQDFLTRSSSQDFPHKISSQDFLPPSKPTTAPCLLTLLAWTQSAVVGQLP